MSSPSPDLFGWWVEPDVLGFLAGIGAGLDVGEYDLRVDDEPQLGRRGLN